MGIPSFYRRLSIAHKGLIGKEKGHKVAALYFDFNCLIYSVVRSPSLPPYTSATHSEWEAALLREINVYILNVWREAGSPNEVFLSVDGVVPVAKIKQQRLRRFKSSWLVNEEIRRGIRKGGDSWDTNAITPGTLFMEKLGLSLRDLCKRKGNGWTVSGADEPGEGEQKIMRLLRSRAPTSFEGSILIYGLDADLILLTLLNGVGNGFPACYLMREDKEFGQKDSPLINSFSFLSVNKLPELLWTDFSSLSPDQKRLRIQTYVCGMSLLGNDFLPHSLSVHVRDDGHDILSRDLLQLEKEGKYLLTTDLNGLQTLNLSCLQEILSRWALKEEDAILQTIRKKRSMKHSTNQVDAEQVLQALPLEWDVEQEVVTYKKNEEGKFRIEFLPVWKRVYADKWLKGHSLEDLVNHYIYGVQWIYDYYTGQRPIPMSWMFPASLPPLWSDIVSKIPTVGPVTPVDLLQLQPQQQLTMVLPLSSWYLIRNKQFRLLPTEYPQYFPKAFGFFSVGRRHLWECEPNICHLPVSLVC
jgi:5'-3' exonuclease